MSADKPIVVGAVIYDPKVTVIWRIIRDFFEQQGCPIDTAFFANYELQVDALLERRLDVAWNSPLAWLDAQHRTGERCRAIAMRDTDRDRRTHLIVRTGSGPTFVDELRGKTVALGARDSPQAALLPTEMLRSFMLYPGEVTLRHFDVMLSLHGDHFGGELEAFRCLERGEAQASAILDLNWERWSNDGTIDPRQFHVLASSEPFDHCNFTVHRDFPAEREKSFLMALFAMSYEDPKHREMMDLEGLKAWLPARTTGYQWLARAVELQKFWEQNL